MPFVAALHALGEMPNTPIVVRPFAPVSSAVSPPMVAGDASSSRRLGLGEDATAGVRGKPLHVTDTARVSGHQALAEIVAFTHERIALMDEDDPVRPVLETLLPGLERLLRPLRAAS